MGSTLTTQSATVLGFANHPTLPRVIVFSTQGVDIYRSSDMQRIAWANINNVTCGTANNNGIYVGTSDTGVYRLPLLAQDFANGQMTQVFGAGATVELGSLNITAIAGIGTDLAIVTDTEFVFLPNDVTAYAYTGGQVLSVAMNETYMAWSDAARTYIFNSHPVADWNDYDVAFLSGTNRLVFEAGTNNLLVCHSAGMRVIDCESPGGEGGLPTNGLICLLTMNGISETTVYDDSRRGNHGTIGGATQVAGYIGKALSFDGTDDYVSIPAAVPNGSAAIAAWFKTTASVDQPIASGQNLALPSAPANYTPFLTMKSDGKIRAEFYTGDPSEYIETTGSYNDGEWHHVALIGDNGGTPTELLYIDGQLVGTRGAADTMAQTWWAYTGIGAGYLDAGRGFPSTAMAYFNGQIDMVRIFNRAITADEVSSLSQEQHSPPSRAGLVASYTMDALYGSTVYDEVGTKNATNNGATQIDGVKGKALFFDGVNDFVETPYTAALQPTKCTVSGWAYRADWSVVPTAETEKIASSTQSGGFALGIDTSGNVEAMFYANGQYQTAETIHTGLAPGWHFFAATYDGRYAKIYVDGEIKTTVDAGSTYNITYAYSNSLIIGGEAGSGTGCSSNFWEGGIEGVRVYNRALSVDEISGLYSEISDPITIAGLVGHWSMDSTYGTTLVEEKGNYNGTITDATKTEGHTGDALSFNGTTAFVEIPHNSALKPTTGISYMVWAHRDDWTTAGNTRLVSCTQSGGWNFEFDVSAVGELSSSIRISGTYYKGVFNYTNLAPGWHFFAATCDGRYVKLYVDGVLQNTGDKGNTGTIDYTYSNSIIIGGEAGDSTGCAGNYWAGRIGAVRLYNRPLHAIEIVKLFSEGLGGYGKNYTTDIGGVTNCKDAWKEGDCIAYGTSDGSAGGRFGILQLAEDGTATSKTTVANTDTASVWLAAGATEAIYNNTYERYRMVAEVSPGAYAREVRRDWVLYAEITDALGGIQSGTVALKINRQAVVPTITAITDGYAVAYAPGSASGYAERVTVELSGTDADGNTVSRTWSFVTASAPAATITDTTPPNVVCTRDIGLADSEADEQVNNVPVIWLDDITGPLIVTDAQAVAVGTVAIDGVTYHRHQRSMTVKPTDANGLQTRDLQQGQVVTMTCPAIGMTAKKCEVLAKQRKLDDDDEITYDLQIAYYEAVS